MESPISSLKLSPAKVVIIVDTTFFGRRDGISIMRSYTTKQNLAWRYVTSEQMVSYQDLRDEIESKGYTISAAVTDGKYGLKEVFADVPVQVCQFHLKMILRRYLTLNPRLEASQELKNLTSNLTKINETDFIEYFTNWENKWNDFLKEKTIHPDGSSSFTHRKLRSARRSIRRHLPYLFTYQNYPELNIPNTTNDIESLNSKIKDLLRIHRGYSKKLRNKIIDEILSKN
jgi:transposase-like protein